MLKLSTFVLLGSALICSQAQAGRFCADPEEVSKRIEDCGDNEYLSEAAVECIEKFEKSLAAAKVSLNAGMAANALMAKDGQSGKQGNSNADYLVSAATLNELIKQAEQAQEETAKFYDSTVWPEDFDEPEVTGPDLDAFLDSDPCYKENRDLMADVMEDFDGYLIQLKEARDVAQKLEASTKGHESDLNSLVPQVGNKRKPARMGQGAPALKTFKGKKSKNGQSDITGTERKKDADLN